MAGKNCDACQRSLHPALTAAEAHRLPHQIQRTVRAADSGGLTEITTKGQAALWRLNRLLSLWPSAARQRPARAVGGLA